MNNGGCLSLLPQCDPSLIAQQAAGENIVDEET